VGGGGGAGCGGGRGLWARDTNAGGGENAVEAAAGGSGCGGRGRRTCVQALARSGAQLRWRGWWREKRQAKSVDGPGRPRERDFL
jgi:hypothetical protein